MALKPDRIETQTDISFFMNALTAERGGCLSVASAGSGVSMDNAQAVAEYAIDPSGAAPLGILLNDVVDTDTTRYPKNFHRDETLSGDKVTILRVGQVTTDQVDGNPSGGDWAYLAASGLLSASRSTDAPKVGQFLSSKDADGFAKVSINIA